jgi:hypothetical protein
MGTRSAGRLALAEAGHRRDGESEEVVAMTILPETSEALRQQAIQRLKKRRDFGGHVLVYLMVYTFLVIIWWMTGWDSFFWPVFPIVFWGIGVVMNAWDVYGPSTFDEAAIRREMEHLQRRG